MSIVDRILFVFIVWGSLVLLTLPARAQEQPLNVPLVKRERDALLKMCESAQWASRMQWDGSCEYLKQKFSEAEEAAKKTAQGAAKDTPQ